MALKKIFLISPVRNAAEDKPQMDRIEAYVKKLEEGGYRVHWPIRNTKQDGDPIGNRICHDNMKAMRMADEIHIWYFAGGGFKNSTGSLFDFGEAFLISHSERQKDCSCQSRRCCPNRNKKLRKCLTLCIRQLQARKRRKANRQKEMPDVRRTGIFRRWNKLQKLAAREKLIRQLAD